MLASTYRISLAAIIAALLLFAVPAQAQFQIQLGLSNKVIKRSLAARGYTKMRIVKRSFKKTHVQACKNGIHYHLRISLTGKVISVEEIGRCRQPVSIAEAQALLRDKGYRRIFIEPQGNAYVAVACSRGERYELALDQFGEIQNSRRVGVCRRALAPSGVAALLREQGYNRIRFTDDELPRYVAEACLNNERFELVLSRRGRIRDKRKIGNCPRPIDPRNLAKILTQQGYNRVEVTDDELPKYVAEGCVLLDRYRVTVNRYGRITRKEKIGACRPVVDRRELVAQLKEHGYRRSSILANASGGFTVYSCKDKRRLFMSFSKFGEVIDYRDLGKCISPSFDGVAAKFRKSGKSKIRYFAEVCEKKKRVRLTLTRFGETVGRKVIGKCR